MNFKSIDDIINFAIKNETEAANFYDEISELESFSGSAEMLKDYANQEREHKEMLEDFLKNKNIVDQYELKWIPDILRSDYLLEVEYKHGMSYIDILRLAMKREEKSLKFYNDMYSKAENDEYKKIFQILAQEEAKHKGVLENMYDDHMAGQGD